LDRSLQQRADRDVVDLDPTFGEQLGHAHRLQDESSDISASRQPATLALDRTRPIGACAAMSAIEDPEPTSAPAGPDRPSDDLEHWLSDLRTEVSADPSGWIDKDSVGEQPTDQAVEPSPLTPGQRGTDAAKPSRGGRHRASD
jgi:hypothetical protein